VISGSTGGPVIFLDVDGPLITFSARSVSGQSSAGGATADQTDWPSNPLLDRLNPDDGPRLLALGCDLVWATTWMADANEVISPRLGLPQLPVVDWPDSDDEPPPGLHWKTMPLARWAAGRSFIWLDDEITDADRRWVAARYAGKALLHRVDPHVGLTELDFSLMRQWLAE
jgi:hypothetical protein